MLVTKQNSNGGSGRGEHTQERWVGGTVTSSGGWTIHAVDNSPAAVSCQLAKFPPGGAAQPDHW